MKFNLKQGNTMIMMIKNQNARKCCKTGLKWDKNPVVIQIR